MAFRKPTHIYFLFTLLIASLLGKCFTIEIGKNNTGIKECIDFCKKDNCSSFCYSSTERSCVIEILPTECPLLVHPSNGSVSYQFGRATNQTVIFSCTKLFHLSGNKALTCLTNGSWNGTVATCEVKQCPILAPPSNGNISYPNGRLVQEQAFFRCAQPYYLSGDSALMCLANWTWGGQYPSCEACFPPWTPVDGKCIRILTGPGGSNVNWNAMATICGNNYATLFIMHTFRVSDIMAFGQLGLCTGYTGVGATITTTFGINNFRLEWTDGSKFQNVSWSTGEPTALPAENCLWFRISAGLYYAGYCGGTTHASSCFICQKI